MKKKEKSKSYQGTIIVKVTKTQQAWIDYVRLVFELDK